MKVIIVGFGSIGSRHYEVLNTLESVHKIDLVTKQVIEYATCFKTLNDVVDMNGYDYFVIASETAKHYKHLREICLKVRDKIILVEKPLYDKKRDDILTSNQIYTAYNLRFHPVLMKLKELLEGEDVYYANILCGQYLPTWRPDRDYRKSYSAEIKLGGGVLRDLSHELDYMCWLFGPVNSLKTINVKRSDLEINSDDIFTAIGVTSARTIVNVTIDYISKNPIRRLIIHTQDNTFEVDVIQNSISISEKDGKLSAVKLNAVDRNYTYSQMHQSILKRHGSDVCSYNEGLKIVDLIDSVSLKEL